MRMLELIMLEAVLMRSLIKLARVLKILLLFLKLIQTTSMLLMLEVLVKIREAILQKPLTITIWL
jgi:hypothetical protein